MTKEEIEFWATCFVCGERIDPEKTNKIIHLDYSKIVKLSYSPSFTRIIIDHNYITTARNCHVDCFISAAGSDWKFWKD